MKKKAIPSLLLAALLVFSLCACGAGTGTGSTAASSAATSAASSIAAPTAGTVSKQELLAVQTGDRNAKAVYSDNFSFSQGVMTYFFAISFNEYAGYLSYFGADAKASLKNQFYEEGTSWFDFFMEEAVAYAERYLIFAEYAREQGLVLTDAQKAYINNQLSEIATEADYYGWDSNTFLEQMFRTNISTDIIRDALSIMVLADAGYEHLIKNLDIEEDEIEKEFLTNYKKYTQLDYVYVDFLSGGQTEAVQQEIAEAFTAAKDRDGFMEALELYAAKCVDQDVLDKSGGAASHARKMLTDNLKTNAGYADSAFLNWAFDEDRKEGDVYVDAEKTSTGAQYAYMLTKLPYRNAVKLVDVRHILFLTETYGTAEKAREQAEKVMAEWLQAGGTEELFAEFCGKYSGDGNASSGGLYEDVTQGYMVQSFNDWIFDESRRYGDYGIVETEYGAHIMFFVGSGESWYKSSRNAVIDNKLEALAADILTRCGITADNDVLQTIVW